MTDPRRQQLTVPPEVVDRLIEATADSALFLVDPTGRISSWNFGAARMMGYAANEVVGRHIRIMYGPDDLDAGVPERLLAEAAGLGQARTEGWRLRADGTRFWSLSTLTALYDEDGTVTCFAKVARDFTERHLMEERLRAAERRMALLGTVVTDANFGEDPLDVTRRAGIHLCQGLGFDLGHFFFVEEVDGEAVLRSGQCFPVDAPGWEAFSEASRSVPIRPGEGLAGGVVTDPLPRVSELTADAGFLRHEAAAAAGLRWGVAIPVLAEDRVVAVLECFSREPRDVSPELREVLTLIGTSLGRVFERAASRRLDRAVARRRLELQESERARVSHELHEEVGQVLTSVRLLLEKAQLESRGREVVMRLEAGLESLEEAIGRIRALSYELRPSTLEELGLPSALQALATARARESGVPVDFVDAGVATLLDERRALGCYRIAEDGVENALRHARPSRVVVRVEGGEGRVRLTVEDDGVGFDVASVLHHPDPRRGLGLHGMKERAELLGGMLQITSTPGRGTRIEAVLPCDQAVP